MKCVKCGQPATEGSMQHPYCTTHFKSVWNNNKESYSNWLDTHNAPQTFTNQDKSFEIELFNDIASKYGDTFEQSVLDNSLNVLKENGVWLEKANILEAGCGNGILGKTILKDTRFVNNPTETSIIGVDIAENMISEANKNKPITYNAIVGDLENSSSFPRATFDYIICFCILHHFPKIDRVFKNFDIWLKDGGTIIIIEPNGSNPISMISRCVRGIVELTLGKNFIVKRRLATPNENNHTIRTYNRFLVNHNFGITTKKCFCTDYKMANYSLKAMSMLNNLRNIMYLGLRKIFPNALFSGEICLLIGKKIIKIKD